METPPRPSTRDSIAVVVPVHNEAENIAPLLREIRAAMTGRDYEIIYVDDGSTDATAAILSADARTHADLRVIRHRSSCGQSAAVITGVRAAHATWIATLDGDGQNDPADIPAMIDIAMQHDRADKPILLAGHRHRRQDDAIKRLSSRIANRVRARLLGDATPDTGCGLKLFRRAVFLDLPQFDHMHRFLPALFIRAGGAVISHPVGHRPRQTGASHYGTWGRLKVGVVDLIGVAWLQRRWNQPEIVAEPPPAVASRLTAFAALPSLEHSA
ncbi:glycosyltransferase family 2 protein [Acidiphilium sp.]|uniref:glycosyltransferase family 2 protein n=1 Tax=Acidiphilium sp. TaxID=527 RepID=UPI003D05D4B1